MCVSVDKVIKIKITFNNKLTLRNKNVKKELNMKVTFSLKVKQERGGVHKGQDVTLLLYVTYCPQHRGTI